MINLEKKLKRFILSVLNFYIFTKTLKMKKIYLILLFLAANINSQSFHWVKTSPIDLTLNPGLVGYCSANDSSGNSYITGYSDNAFNYGDIFGDLLFNKYDASGEPIYSRSFPGHGTVYDIAVDNDGNVFLAIGYVELITVGTLQLSTANIGIQPLLVKLDPDGNLMWHYIPQITGSSSVNFEAVSVDHDGNVYIGYDSYNDSYIEKLSPAGASLLTITQLEVKMLTSVDTDLEGNIYAAGSCAEPNASFAGIAVPTTLDYNTWLVKYSPAGIYQWSKYVEDITCSHPKVKANTPDEVYFSSYLFGAYEFDSITTLGPVSGAFNDFFIAKINASGTFQWVREVPAAGTVYTGNRNYLDSDAVGNVYFAGACRGPIDWGNGITTTGNGFSSDALLLKYDAAGNLQLAKTAGGLSEDRIDGITASATGDIFVGGLARQDANFDDIQHLSGDFVPYPFLGKISTTLPVNKFAKNQLILYPNPVADYLHVGGTIGPIHIAIYNLVGQKMLEFDGKAADLSSLAKGVYLVDAAGYIVKVVKI